jgi:hypothetical protein
MTVMEDVPTKGVKALFVVLRMSVCLALVLLAAAFITEWKLFDSTLMLGLFAWACVGVVLSIFGFAILRLIESPSSHNNR